MFISGGENGEEATVKIDSNGVEIQSKGKKKVIKKGENVNIEIN